MAFIPMNKMKMLREASKNGDERAKKIIMMQLNNEDFGKDLDDYFKNPQENTPTPVEGQNLPKEQSKVERKSTGIAGLDTFLEGNGISEGDEDYEDAIYDYFNEYPNEIPEEGIESLLKRNDEPQNEESHEENIDDVLDFLIKDENEAIDGYDKAIKFVVNCDKIEGVVKQAYLDKLNHIKNEELEHIEELKALKK